MKSLYPVRDLCPIPGRGCGLRWEQEVGFSTMKLHSLFGMKHGQPGLQNTRPVRAGPRLPWTCGLSVDTWGIRRGGCEGKIINHHPIEPLTTHPSFSGSSAASRSEGLGQMEDLDVSFECLIKTITQNGSMATLTLMMKLKTARCWKRKMRIQVSLRKKSLMMHWQKYSETRI